MLKDKIDRQYVEEDDLATTGNTLQKRGELCVCHFGVFNVFLFSRFFHY